MATEVLEKIGTIEIPYPSNNPPNLNYLIVDVARNGKYYIVEDCGMDSYGVTIHKVSDNIADAYPVDGLVQVIGKLIEDQGRQIDALRVERDALAAQLASAVRVAKE